jgi:hypothetical protein
MSNNNTNSHLHLPNWLKLSKELTTLLANHDKIYELLDGPTTAMG